MLSIQPCPSVQWFDSLQQNGYISSVMPLIEEIKTLWFLQLEKANCHYFLDYILYSCAIIDILSIQWCPSVQRFDSQQQNGYISFAKPLIKETKTLAVFKPPLF